MNIYTATDDFYNSVGELFSQHGDVKILPRNPEEYRNLPIDLLIFTGGEDVNPERYGHSNKRIRFSHKRDEWEFSLLSDIMRKNTKVNKTLGICRGLQVINVGMGGTLIEDIRERFGVDHEYSHPLNWRKESPMSILTETNSMHHQGIEEIGRTFTPHVLAVEPITKVIEIIQWGSAYFGVQFHPEFFPDTPIRRDIANMIATWAMGGLELVLPNSAEKAVKQTSAEYVYFNTAANGASLSIGNYAGAWVTDVNSQEQRNLVENNDEDEPNEMEEYIPEEEEEEEE